MHLLPGSVEALPSDISQGGKLVPLTDTITGESDVFTVERAFPA